LLQKIALACAGVLFATALCESAAWLLPRALLPPRLRDLMNRMELDRQTDDVFVADSELLFKMRPHVDFVADHPDYHVRVKTNLNLADIGFRGGSLGGPAWAAAVGDSFTFGVGVDQEDTWVYRLAKGLKREVVNLGIPGQGPPQYTRVLKHYALALHPRVIFYCFYFNDLPAANRFYRMKRTLVPVSRYLRQYSVLFNLIRSSRSPVEEPAKFRGDGVELGISAKALQRTLERQNRSFERNWKLTVKELDEAIRASKEANAELVMLYLPSQGEAYWELIKAQDNLPDSLDIDRLRRTVVEYCGVRKIACFDLTPALKREAEQGKQLYFRSDGHWNKEGNRIVAEALQKFLIEKGLVE
jgi:lysophospholipase L1-like esterase